MKVYWGTCLFIHHSLETQLGSFNNGHNHFFYLYICPSTQQNVARALSNYLGGTGEFDAGQ